jgi:hypothetical protein
MVSEIGSDASGRETSAFGGEAVVVHGRPSRLLFDPFRH